MPARIALITDSTADLPPALIQERGIYVVPQNIIWGRETLKDGIDLDAERFYKRLAAESELPKTAQPTPTDYAELYQRIRHETGVEAIVNITISAELSGTYASAEQATRMVDFPVYVVDSRNVSMGEGLIVLKAAQARDAGASAAEVTQVARDMISRSNIIFTVNTLEYLHRGGRIGNAKWLLGTALSIKPILHVKNGRIDALESVRTRRRALNRLVEVFSEQIDPAKPLWVGVVHGDAAEEAAAIKAEIVARWKPELLIDGTVGLAVGTHAGPGVVGMAFLQG